MSRNHSVPESDVSKGALSEGQSIDRHGRHISFGMARGTVEHNEY